MSLNDKKDQALELFSQGINLKGIAEKTKVSLSLVEEWVRAEDSADFQKNRFLSEFNKALQDFDGEIDKKEMDRKIKKMSELIMARMGLSFEDPALSKTLNMAADTLQKLRVALDGKSPLVNIDERQINLSGSGLEKFKNIISDK